jgi:DnaJ-class molecular chaperone
MTRRKPYRLVVCSHCQGSGEIHLTNRSGRTIICPKCSGAGILKIHLSEEKEK